MLYKMTGWTVGKRNLNPSVCSQLSHWTPRADYEIAALQGKAGGTSSIQSFDVLSCRKCRGGKEHSRTVRNEDEAELEAERGRAYLLHLHGRASGREELASRRYNTITTT